MRILQVITSLLPGGAETLVANLTERFAADGIDIEVAVFNAVETPLIRQLTKKGIKVHRLTKGGGSPYSIKNYFKLKKLIKTGNYDVVHSHNTAAQLYSAMCNKRGTTKYVTTEHNTDNRRRGKSLYRHIDRWMYDKYDKIVCISEKTAENLVDHIGEEYHKKISIIKNGIDLPRYRHDIRQIEDDKPIVVTMVAGFRAQKDQDTLVRAIAKLPSRYRLQLVGDGERRPTVEKLVKDLDLHNKVDFLGMRTDIPAILKDTDIAVLSSHYEGLSLASIEAMASGRPLVASDVEGISEVVKGHGLLFAEGDDDALADTLLRLSKDNSYYIATAEACQKEAEKYDINITAELYKEIYTNV